MKITFLGTGTSTGVPVIGCQCRICQSTDERDKRLRSSILWEMEDVSIIIDAGPDFRMQLIRAKCSKIDAILITHKHYDHVGGLDDVRGLNYTMKRPIDIYAEKYHAEAIRNNLGYVFEVNKYPGVPQINLNVIDNKPFDVRGVRVEPIRIMHAKMKIFGYRIGNCAYVTDASYIPEESMKKLEGCDTLVINALREEPHMSHLSISQAIEVIERLKPKRAYLTHIGHEFGLYEEMNDRLPDGVFMAYDGLTVEV